MRKSGKNQSHFVDENLKQKGTRGGEKSHKEKNKQKKPKNIHTSQQ